MRKLALPILVGLFLTVVLGVAVSSVEPTATVKTLNSGQHFLPPYPNVRDRFGFDSERSHPLTEFDVALLNAGWYSDWGASLDPDHPDQLTYVQLIRFNAGQCDSGLYDDPAEVTVSPSRATIAQIAAAHPGSLWLLGNEPDSCYHRTPVAPDVYAHVYHEFYHYIKGVDPTALIANGGIVQPTPCRMMYLDVVRDTYEQAYGESMPVDVWNIHAFTLREVYNSWGASTPPGVPTSCAMDYKIYEADDIGIFRDNLRAFRQWMKDKGEQNKPLIISEYGILWPDWLNDEHGQGFPPARVSHFMTQTFDLFLTETFAEVGYPEDDYRLVQTWAWYSLSEDSQYNGNLFHSNSKEISAMGQAYSDYTAALPDVPYVDLTAQGALDLSPLEKIALGTPYETTSVSLPVLAYVTNLGNMSVSDVPVVTHLSSGVFTSTISLPVRYAADISPLPVASFVLTQPAVYNFAPEFPIVLDPGDTVNDPRTWNNTATVTMPAVIDARPDLVISETIWSVKSSGPLSGVLNLTMTVANEGIWPAPPVSGTISLRNIQGSLLLPSEQFSIPALVYEEQVTLTRKVSLAGLTGDLYYMTLEVDSSDVADEPDEDNNRVDVELDIRPDLTISAMTQEVRLPEDTTDGYVSINLTVTNEGLYSAVPTSGTLSVGEQNGTLLLPIQSFSIPGVAVGAQVTSVRNSELPAVGVDFYRLKVRVDSGEILEEVTETNNQVEVVVPVPVTTTLEPGMGGVLTSTSGHMVFWFPTDAVTATTEIRFTPLLTSELPPGPMISIAAFQLAAYRGGQPVSYTFSSPVTVTWTYTDTDVVGLDEGRLKLYYLGAGDSWRSVSSPMDQHRPDENWMRAYLQELGTYTFGGCYGTYLPLVLKE